MAYFRSRRRASRRPFRGRRSFARKRIIRPWRAGRRF